MNGKQVCDNIHSYDVIQAFEAFRQNPRPGQVYNLGGGRENSISILEAFDLVEEVSGHRVNWLYEEQHRTGGHICYISDLRKLQSHFPTWRITRSTAGYFTGDDCGTTRAATAGVNEMNGTVQQHLMIFELETAGHHPGYLRHLLHYWPDSATRLTLVVAPDFAARHSGVIATVSKALVHWLPITEEELHWYEESKRSLVRRAWVEWRLYCRYARAVQADQGLIMYIDRFQLPMALRLFLPCPTSGIFFRPKFHYEQFAKHQPTRSEQVRSLRERWLWRSALGHSQLKTLFSLDPLAVEPLRALRRNANVIALPDPVEWYTPATATDTTLRQALGIEPGRKVLLLFGMIDRRKGVYQVLEALQQLPASEQARLTLLLVGPVAEADRAAVTTTVDVLRCESSLQIVLCDRFIADAEIQPYFALADLVLALYQRHVGMSAILVRAAAAGKPVLASEYGLMGEMVRHHGLGTVVDSADATTIAAKVHYFFEQPTASPFSPVTAAKFAKENSVETFVQLLWKNSSSSFRGLTNL